MTPARLIAKQFRRLIVDDRDQVRSDMLPKIRESAETLHLRHADSSGPTWRQHDPATDLGFFAILHDFELAEVFLGQDNTHPPLLDWPATMTRSKAKRDIARAVGKPEKGK